MLHFHIDPGRYAIVGVSVAASLTAILAGVTASRRRRERDQARERLLREQEEELHARPGDNSHHP